MTRDTSYMFVTGPDVIKTVTPREVTKQELGGAMTHNATSGVAHFIARDDRECLAMIRELMSFLPSSNLEDPPMLQRSDPPDRADESLNRLVPEDPMQPYDMKDAIPRDRGRRQLLRSARTFRAKPCCRLRKTWWPACGIVANQPAFLAGVLDINASVKGARFVRFL